MANPIINIGVAFDLKRPLRELEAELDKASKEGLDLGVSKSAEKEINSLKKTVKDLSIAIDQINNKELGSAGVAQLEKDFNAKIQSMTERTQELQNCMSALMSTMSSAQKEQVSKTLENITGKANEVIQTTSQLTDSISSVNKAASKETPIKINLGYTKQYIHELEEISRGLHKIEDYEGVELENLSADKAKQQLQDLITSYLSFKKQLEKSKPGSDEFNGLQKNIAETSLMIQRFSEDLYKNILDDKTLNKIFRNKIDIGNNTKEFAENIIKDVINETDHVLQSLDNQIEIIKKSAGSLEGNDKKGYKIPVVLGTTKSDFLNKVLDIINYVRKNIKDENIEVGISLVTEWGNRKQKELFKDFSEKVQAISKETGSEEIKSIYDDITKYFNDEITIKIKSDIDQVAPKIIEKINDIRDSIKKDPLKLDLDAPVKETEEAAESQEKVSKFANMTKEELEECLKLEERYIKKCKEGSDKYKERKADIEEITKLLAEQAEKEEKVNKPLKIYDESVLSGLNELAKKLDEISKSSRPISEDLFSIQESLEKLKVGGITQTTDDVEKLDADFEKIKQDLLQINGALRKDNLTKIQNAFKAYTDYLDRGGKRNYTELSDQGNIQNYFKNHLKNILNTSENDYRSSGRNVGLQFAEGITESIGEIVGAVTEMVNVALNTIQIVQDSASPSKKTYELGWDFVAGYAEGIHDGIKNVSKAAGELADNGLGELALETSERGKQFADSLEKYLDTTPKNKNTFFSDLSANFERADDELQDFINDLGIAEGKLKLISDGANNFGGIVGQNKTLIARQTSSSKSIADVKELQSLLEKAHDEGIGVARILDIIESKTGKTYLEIQETVSGKPIQDENFIVDLDVLKATDDQINKLLSDIVQLYNIGIDPDIENLSNVFYDVEKGVFTLIDLGKHTEGGISSFKNVNDVLDSFIRTLRDQAEDIEDVANKDAWNKLADRAETLAASVIDAANKGAAKAQQSRSPSKVAEKLGEYWGEGYAKGIRKHAKDVEQSIRELVNSGKLTVEDLQEDLNNLQAGNFGNRYKQLGTPLQNILADNKSTDIIDRYKAKVNEVVPELITNFTNLGEEAKNVIRKIQEDNLEGLKKGILEVDEAVDKLADAFYNLEESQKKSRKRSLVTEAEKAVEEQKNQNTQEQTQALVEEEKQAEKTAQAEKKVAKARKQDNATDEIVESESKLLPIVVETNEEMQRRLAIHKAFLDSIGQSDQAKREREIANILEEQIKAKEQLNKEDKSNENNLLSGSDGTSDIGLTYDQLIKKIQLENEEIAKGNREFKERVTLLDEQNKVIASWWGDEHHVEASAKDIEAVQGAKKLIHTHPDMGRFSSPDLDHFFETSINEFLLHYKDSILKLDTSKLDNSSKEAIADIMRTFDLALRKQYEVTNIDELSPEMKDRYTAFSQMLFSKLVDQFGGTVEISGSSAEQASKMLSNFEEMVVNKIISDISKNGFDTYRIEDTINKAMKSDPNQINVNETTIDQLVDRFKTLRDETDRTFEQTCELYEIYQKLGGTDIPPMMTGLLDEVTDDQLDNMRKALELSNETPVSSNIEESIQPVNKLGEELKETGEQGETATDNISEGLSQVREEVTKTEEKLEEVNKVLELINRIKANPDSIIDQFQTLGGSLSKTPVFDLKGWSKQELALLNAWTNSSDFNHSLDAVQTWGIGGAIHKSIDLSSITSSAELIKNQNNDAKEARDALQKEYADFYEEVESILKDWETASNRRNAGVKDFNFDKEFLPIMQRVIDQFGINLTDFVDTNQSVKQQLTAFVGVWRKRFVELNQKVGSHQPDTMMSSIMDSLGINGKTTFDKMMEIYSGSLSNKTPAKSLEQKYSIDQVTDSLEQQEKQATETRQEVEKLNNEVNKSSNNKSNLREGFKKLQEFTQNGTKDTATIVSQYIKYQQNNGKRPLSDLTKDEAKLKELTAEYERQTKAVKEDTAAVEELENTRRNDISTVGIADDEMSMYAQWAKENEQIEEALEQDVPAIDKITEGIQGATKAADDLLEKLEKLPEIVQGGLNPIDTKYWRGLDRIAQIGTHDDFRRDTKKWENEKRYTEKQITDATNILKLAGDFQQSGNTSYLKELYNSIDTSEISNSMKKDLKANIRKIVDDIEKGAEEAVEETVKEKKPTKMVTMSRQKYKEYVRQQGIIADNEAFNYNFDLHLKGLERKGLAEQLPTKSGKGGKWVIKVEVEDDEAKQNIQEIAELTEKELKDLTAQEHEFVDGLTPTMSDKDIKQDLAKADAYEQIADAKKRQAKEQEELNRAEREFVDSLTPTMSEEEIKADIAKADAMEALAEAQRKRAEVKKETNTPIVPDNQAKEIELTAEETERLAKAERNFVDSLNPQLTGEEAKNEREVAKALKEVGVETEKFEQGETLDFGNVKKQKEQIKETTEAIKEQGKAIDQTSDQLDRRAKELAELTGSGGAIDPALLTDPIEELQKATDAAKKQAEAEEKVTEAIKEQKAVVDDSKKAAKTASEQITSSTEESKKEVDDLAKGFEKLKQLIADEGNFNLSKNQSKSRLQKYVDQFIKYKESNGEKELSDLTDNPKALGKLQKEYERQIALKQKAVEAEQNVRSEQAKTAEQTKQDTSEKKKETVAEEQNISTKAKSAQQTKEQTKAEKEHAEAIKKANEEVKKSDQEKSPAFDFSDLTSKEVQSKKEITKATEEQTKAEKELQKVKKQSDNTEKASSKTKETTTAKTKEATKQTQEQTKAEKDLNTTRAKRTKNNGATASAQGAEKEAKSLGKVQKSAIDAAKAKEAFSEANRKVLDSIIESLNGLKNEGTAFGNLSRLTNSLGGKNGAEKLEATRNGLQEIIKALSVNVDNNSLIDVLHKITENGSNLADIATILRASKKNLEDALNVKDTSDIDELLNNNIQSIVENAKSAMQELGGAGSSIINVSDITKTKDGFLEIVGLIRTADDNLQQFTLHTKDGLEFQNVGVKENTAQMAKQMKMYAQIEEYMKRMQQKGEMLSDRVFINPDLESEVWEQMLSYVEEYRDYLGEIKSITLQTRQDATGEKRLESWSVNGKNGSHVTVGPTGNVVASHQDILSTEELTKKIGHLISKRKEYNELLDKRVNGNMSAQDLSNLNALDAEYQEIIESVERLNRLVGENSAAQQLQRLNAEMTTDFNKTLTKFADSAGNKINNALKTKNNQLTAYVTEYSDQIKQAQEYIEEFYETIKNHPADTGYSDEERQKIQAMANQVSDVTKSLNNLGNVYQPLGDVDKLIGKISTDLNDNTAMSGRLKRQFTELRDEVKRLRGDSDNTEDSLSQIDKITYKRLTQQFNTLHSQMIETQQTGDSFFRSLSKAAKNQSVQFLARYLSFYDIIRYLRQAVDTVKELDSALTELRKVSDASTERLEQSFRKSATTAQELGSTISDVINITADWARLGFDVDSAEELARVTTLFKTVGDNMSADDASSYLISTMQGFQLAADQSETIIDRYNEVANNFAIDTAGIGEALKRSAASFDAANTDLSKSIALITATNEVVQNPESVGTLWKTLSARIRGKNVPIYSENYSLCYAI